MTSSGCGFTISGTSDVDNITGTVLRKNSFGKVLVLRNTLLYTDLTAFDNDYNTSGAIPIRGNFTAGILKMCAMREYIS